jgi:predicted nucleic acid-binding Zn ribbon protein
VRRAAPRPLALALSRVRESLQPATPLAAIQRAWPEAVGELVAREAQPVAERAGVVTVACRSAVWAQELDLLAPDVVERLNQAVGGPAVQALRCVATGAG